MLPAVEPSLQVLVLLPALPPGFLHTSRGCRRQILDVGGTGVATPFPEAPGKSLKYPLARTQLRGQGADTTSGHASVPR